MLIKSSIFWTIYLTLDQHDHCACVRDHLLTFLTWGVQSLDLEGAPTWPVSPMYGPTTGSQVSPTTAPVQQQPCQQLSSASIRQGGFHFAFLCLQRTEVQFVLLLWSSVKYHFYILRGLHTTALLDKLLAISSILRSMSHDQYNSFFWAHYHRSCCPYASTEGKASKAGIQNHINRTTSTEKAWR